MERVNSKKILVVGGDTSYYKPFIPFYELVKDENQFFNNPKSIDLVLFTGGADVTPLLYGEISKGMSCTKWSRDQEETRVFDLALRHNVLMCGICRGMQLLNVMDKGRLIHHLSGHPNEHLMYSNKGTIRVNSLHHQVCIPSRTSVVIGWSDVTGEEKFYGNYDKELKNWPGFIPEAMLFPNINAYGVQWHPEMMANSSVGYNWFSDLVREFHTNDNTMEKILNKWSHHSKIVWEETKEKNKQFQKNKVG